MQRRICVGPKRGTSCRRVVTVAALLAFIVGCQQGSRSRTRDGLAHDGSGVGSSAVDQARGSRATRLAGSAVSPDGPDAKALPVVALRNWKLHVEHFAGRVAATHGQVAVRIADYSFDTSIGGNFAWRERGVDYGRWQLDDKSTQTLRDLVSSAAFFALSDQPDDGGPRLQITLAWPGGQRVVTVNSPATTTDGAAPTDGAATTTAQALQHVADDAVASYRSKLRTEPAQRTWSIAVTGPFIAARETVTLTGAGELSVQLAPKSSKRIDAAGPVAPAVLGRIAHLLSLPAMRTLPRRVAADTTVPISFRLQLTTVPPLVMDVESALLPQNAELSELWDAVAAARRAVATR